MSDEAISDEPFVFEVKIPDDPQEQEALIEDLVRLFRELREHMFDSTKETPT